MQWCATFPKYASRLPWAFHVAVQGSNLRCWCASAPKVSRQPICRSWRMSLEPRLVSRWLLKKLGNRLPRLVMCGRRTVFWSQSLSRRSQSVRNYLHRTAAASTCEELVQLNNFIWWSWWACTHAAQQSWGVEDMDPKDAGPAELWYHPSIAAAIARDHASEGYLRLLVVATRAAASKSSRY